MLYELLAVHTDLALHAGVHNEAVAKVLQVDGVVAVHAVVLHKVLAAARGEAVDVQPRAGAQRRRLHHRDHARPAARGLHVVALPFALRLVHCINLFRDGAPLVVQVRPVHQHRHAVNGRQVWGRVLRVDVELGGLLVAVLLAVAVVRLHPQPPRLGAHMLRVALHLDIEPHHKVVHVDLTAPSVPQQVVRVADDGAAAQGAGRQVWQLRHKVGVLVGLVLAQKPVAEAAVAVHIHVLADVGVAVFGVVHAGARLRQQGCDLPRQLKRGAALGLAHAGLR
mmetsp:Transcript_8883/g.22774  ORF Transcript_8883/g.22774 Transcript_8883/m.22774 type:complete len:280 (+) Transcript_8883:139-978(+)